MGSHDAFKKREHAIEQGYFAAQDKRLLEKLRATALLGELADALREKLEVDDTELLQRIQDLGFDEATSPALLLAPLVHVAWIDGRVASSEREAVLEVARSRGIEAGSPAHAKLVSWLDTRPSDELFDTALSVINAGLAVLPLEEREEREQRMTAACKHVAMASGGVIAMLGLGGGEISKQERQLLDSISKRLHERDEA